MRRCCSPCVGAGLGCAGADGDAAVDARAGAGIATGATATVVPDDSVAGGSGAGSDRAGIALAPSISAKASPALLRPDGRQIGHCRTPGESLRDWAIAASPRAMRVHDEYGEKANKVPVRSRGTRSGPSQK